MRHVPDRSPESMFLHQYAIMQDTNRRQYAESFTGTRFRRLGREPLTSGVLGRDYGSGALLLDSSIPQFLNSSILQFVKSTRQVVKSTRNSSIPQFFKSSSPQETSRASASPADPDAYINGALIARTRRIYQLVHLFTVMSSMCSVTGSTYIYLVYSPSCLEKISHATTRRENPRTLDW